MARIDPVERAAARLRREAEQNARFKDAQALREDRKGKIKEGIKDKAAAREADYAAAAPRHAMGDRTPGRVARGRDKTIDVTAELGKGLRRSVRDGSKEFAAEWKDSKPGVKRAFANGGKNTLQGSGYALGTAAYWTGRGPWVGLSKATKGLWESNSRLAKVALLVVAPLALAAGALNLTRKAGVAITKAVMVHTGREQKYNQPAKAFQRPDEALKNLVGKQVADRAQTRDMKRMMDQGLVDKAGNLQFDGRDTAYRRTQLDQRAAHMTQADKLGRGHAGRALADVTTSAKNLNDPAHADFKSTFDQVSDTKNALNDIHKSVRRDFGVDGAKADKIMTNLFGADVHAAVGNIDTSQPLSQSEQDLLGGLNAYAAKSAKYSSKSMNWEMAGNAAVVRNAAVGMGASSSGKAELTAREGNQLEAAGMDLGATDRLWRTSSNFEANSLTQRGALDRSAAVAERAVELNPVMQPNSRSSAESFGVAI